MDSRKKRIYKIYLLTSVKKLVLLRSYSQQRGWKVKTHQGPKVCWEPNEINPDKGSNWTVTHMGSPQPQNRKLSAKVWLQILPQPWRPVSLWAGLLSVTRYSLLSISAALVDSFARWLVGAAFPTNDYWIPAIFFIENSAIKNIVWLRC